MDWKLSAELLFIAPFLELAATLAAYRIGQVVGQILQERGQ